LLLGSNQNAYITIYNIVPSLMNIMEISANICCRQSDIGDSSVTKLKYQQCRRSLHNRYISTESHNVMYTAKVHTRQHQGT